MLPRSLGQFLVERKRRHGAGWVVRIADPEQCDVVPGTERVEVGQPTGCLTQGHRHHLAPGEHRTSLIDRIGRLGNRNDALLAQRDLREREDRLLRAERRHDLDAGIDVDCEAPPDPACDCLAKLRQPRGAWVGRNLVDRREHGLADERRRQLARVAHAEIDQLDPAGLCLGLPVVEPRERVLRQIGEDGGELHA